MADDGGRGDCCGRLVSAPVPVPAQEKKAAPTTSRSARREAVEKGLEWLKKNQAADGHWAAGRPVPDDDDRAGGMCFLMEGSTLKEGSTEQIRKAVEWFTAPNRQQPNGCLGDIRNPTESSRYMYGHGFGTMFLASVYGEEGGGEGAARTAGEGLEEGRGLHLQGADLQEAPQARGQGS